MKSYTNRIFNQKIVSEFFDNKIEESINLDYKRGESLVNSDKAKKELSKDVSSFANSDGGIIIYGVEEIDHIPSNYVFVDGNQISKEWIELFDQQHQKEIKLVNKKTILFSSL